MERIIKVLLLTFVFTMLITSTCFAADTYPNHPTVSNAKYYEYIIYTSPANDTYMVMAWSTDNEFDISFEYDIGNTNINMHKLTDNSTIYWRKYRLDNEGTIWTELGGAALFNADFANVHSFAANYTINYSTTEVYDENGTSFFPQSPLLETIVGESLETMSVKILRAMMILATIAVSLLALWISLRVLLKVSNRFLR